MKLFPSAMCFNVGKIEEEVISLEEAGVDGFHIDVMDGHYVPNIALGLNEIRFIRENTRLPVDAHLMVRDPSKFVDFYANLGIDILYFHPDADEHPTRTIDSIKNAGMKAGVVINPGVEIETINSILKISDYALLMTVNPGFAGQSYLDFVDDKIPALRKHDHLTIFADGALSRERVKNLSEQGIDGFVLGTSALFGKNQEYFKLIKDIRE